MANIWKQVMFNLKVQPPNVPGEDLRLRRKICCVVQLIDRPVRLDVARLVWHWIVRGGNHVCWLENNGKYESSDKMHRDETKKSKVPGSWAKPEWTNNKQPDIDDFEQNNEGHVARIRRPLCFD